MIEQFTDLELLRELVRRNGRAEAPWKVQRAVPFFSTLVALGNDDTVEIIWPTDVADPFQL